MGKAARALAVGSQPLLATDCAAIGRLTAPGPSPGAPLPVFEDGVSLCTYNCIDTAYFHGYAVFSRVPCDLHGTRTRTARTCASTTFALRLPFSFSTIPTRLRDETTTQTMRSAG